MDSYVHGCYLLLRCKSLKPRPTPQLLSLKLEPGNEATACLGGLSVALLILKVSII